jgi:hypothetical protein
MASEKYFADAIAVALTVADEWPYQLRRRNRSSALTSKQGNKRMPALMCYYEYKAVTFNGNIVTVKSETQEHAIAELHDAASDVGSCVKKIFSKHCMVRKPRGNGYWRFPA